MKSHKFNIFLILLVVLFPSVGAKIASQNRVLASHAFSLDNRYQNRFVNDVFKQNILLTIAYMNGSVSGSRINWNQVDKPFQYTFTLKPGETFAFHDEVLPQFRTTLAKTTHAHFNGQEGFLSDGYLFGDGVCHFASLMYWTAKDANLQALAPSNHNFARIPEISKEYGVAIYSQKDEPSLSAQQNLYITNNLANPVEFKFEHKNDQLTVAIAEKNSSDSQITVTSTGSTLGNL